MSSSPEEPGSQQHVSTAWLIIPPFAFLLKDLIATIALLSTEPGITARAAFYYGIAMLPGSWISGESAMLSNLGFGVAVGILLYFVALLRHKRWSVGPPEFR